MSGDKPHFHVPPAEGTSDPATAALANKLLIDMSLMADVTSLSVRTLRRLDANRDIPGRVVVGRRVLFQTEVIREWVRSGLPDRAAWALLHKNQFRR